MTHEIIIITEKTNCILTKAAQLKDYAEQLIELYEGTQNEPPSGYHATMERAQTLVTAVCDGTPITQGAINDGCTLDAVIAEMETMLGI